MKLYYDWVIVGAGPAGLALAQSLSSVRNIQSILVLESLPVVGGCHRVVRVPYQGHELFTEHGPRIYVDNYNNFKFLLKKMGHDFGSLFTPYHYSFLQELFQHSQTFSWKELIHMAGAFFLFLLDEHYGKKTTLLEFTTQHEFSPITVDKLDRMARMTDGASIHRYTLNQFFQIVNQQLFAKVYQPKLPNDKGFLKVWQDYLQQQPNVEILLGHDVIHLSYQEELNQVQSLWVFDKKNHNTIEIKCNHVVLAVPPHAIARILGNCSDPIRNSFMPYSRLLRFVQHTNYLPYLSITFHWTTKQEISKRHGFPTGEWGVIYIVLSDYMEETYSKTLLSCCLSYLDRKSSVTGKTANQSTPDEVIEETFQQLQHVMPFLSKPTIALISPQNYYDKNLKQWKQQDVSYFDSSSQENKPFPTCGKVSNLYNVGTHNGNSLYQFTTLESAVSNALFLAHQLEPSIQQEYPLQPLWTLHHFLQKSLMVIVILFLFLLVVVVFMKKKIKNKQ